jgi:ABC-type Fe3+ transport system permease subunit
MGKAKNDERKPATAEAGAQGQAGEPRPSSGRSDTLLNMLLLALFLLLCALSWWLVRRQAIHAAPGAPTGQRDGRSERPACLVVAVFAALAWVAGLL